jgi:hypothetical protein
MPSSVPSSSEAYLNSRKHEIYHHLYSLKNSVSQVHQSLCQYSETWTTYVYRPTTFNNLLLSLRLIHCFYERQTTTLRYQEMETARTKSLERPAKSEKTSHRVRQGGQFANTISACNPSTKSSLHPASD